MNFDTGLTFDSGLIFDLVGGWVLLAAAGLVIFQTFLEDSEIDEKAHLTSFVCKSDCRAISHKIVLNVVSAMVIVHC